MTAAHEDRAPAHLTRRLSVLPAAVGLLGIVWALIGAWAAGLGDGARGGVLTVGVAALVLATVVSGSTTGLYAGLALLIVGALAGGDGELDRGELIALVLAVIVVNETVRFSLDARRPARLGPGLVGRYLARTVAVAAASTALVVGLWVLADRQPDGPGWVPIGLAAAGLPPLALWAAQRADRRGGPRAGSAAPAHSPRPAPRLVLAVLVTAAVLALAVIGARARSGIESGGTSPTETVTTTTTVTVPVAEVEPIGPAEFRRGLTILFLIAATLVVGALYLALRRPEAVFDLDDLDYDNDEHSFGLAPPGRAEAASTVEVDDDDLARLLADLRLDIEAEADPGRAVRFAYANVERRLAELDLTRRPEDTEREFLARALAQFEEGAALTELTRLFERARFGTDPVDEGMRGRALAAIADLEASLSSRPAPARATGDPTTPGPASDPGPDVGEDGS